MAGHPYRAACDTVSIGFNTVYCALCQCNEAHYTTNSGET